MPQKTPVEQDITHDLGGGLIMRKARPEDRERLAEFHGKTLLDIGQTDPDINLQTWVSDLMSGEHPTFRPGDFLLVEDTKAGKIVSSVGHISQIWTYEGVPFKFGQPEIVSTDPAYRNRGLVRAQFNEVHNWSAARGELVQGITGIPWYYRQFGYEMALNLGGNRVAYKPQIPRLKEGEQEAFRFRNAVAADIHFIREMYAQETSRYALASVRDEALWKYDLEGRSEKSGFGTQIMMIETLDGESAGLIIHSKRAAGSVLRSYLCEAKPGVPFLSIMPAVMRYLAATGEEYAQRDGGELSAIAFVLSAQHPVYDTIKQRLPRINEPYAWYIRVPDLPAFVNHIAYALEKRLADSPQAGFTGEIMINFFKTGLKLKFDKGIITADSWKPARVEEGQVAFPDLTFLQLLFGYRSLDEILRSFPDASVQTDEARALLPILFPKKDSGVWPGG